MFPFNFERKSRTDGFPFQNIARNNSNESNVYFEYNTSFLYRYAVECILIALRAGDSFVKL